MNDGDEGKDIDDAGEDNHKICTKLRGIYFFFKFANVHQLVGPC